MHLYKLLNSCTHITNNYHLIFLNTQNLCSQNCFKTGRDICTLISHYKSFNKIHSAKFMLDFVNIKTRKYMIPSIREKLGPIS